MLLSLPRIFAWIRERGLMFRTKGRWEEEGVEGTEKLAHPGLVQLFGPCIYAFHSNTLQCRFLWDCGSHRILFPGLSSVGSYSAVCGMARARDCGSREGIAQAGGEGGLVSVKFLISWLNLLPADGWVSETLWNWGSSCPGKWDRKSSPYWWLWSWVPSPSQHLPFSKSSEDSWVRETGCPLGPLSCPPAIASGRSSGAGDAQRTSYFRVSPPLSVLS